MNEQAMCWFSRAPAQFWIFEPVSVVATVSQTEKVLISVPLEILLVAYAKQKDKTNHWIGLCRLYSVFAFGQ